jgi:hypothetical protein
MVGSLFHCNEPSGTGLVSGAVFGRSAGRSAASERMASMLALDLHALPAKGAAAEIQRAVR